MDHELSGMDRAILSLDRGLRTLFGPASAARRSPAADVPESPLAEEDRRHAAGLMRVNHTGEVCAQALYEGQALVARQPSVRELLLSAAREEHDHLAWCEDRLRALHAQPSVLNPAFYAASWGLGVVTGVLGDRVSLGFVEATEDQVAAHLSAHLTSLPHGDRRSRAVIETMRAEETAHGARAIAAGGRRFSGPVRVVMRLLSRVMTASTYRI